MHKNHRNIGNLYLTRKDFSMKNFKRILALAIAVMAIACTFSANAFAADHGTETFTFSRDGGTTQTTGQLQLYTDAIVTDSNGNWISTNLYAYGARGVRVADKGHYETYVGYEYMDTGYSTYDEVESVPDSTQGTSSAKAKVTIDYTWQDPINSRGVLIMYGVRVQLCRHFNDDSESKECTHYETSLQNDGYGYCAFDENQVTW